MQSDRFVQGVGGNSSGQRLVTQGARRNYAENEGLGSATKNGGDARNGVELFSGAQADADRWRRLLPKTAERQGISVVV
jgi:hypothetical protein